MKNRVLSGFVPTHTLQEQVANFLRDLILSGRLKPGEKVVERALAGSLGVAQATVRQALQVLEYEGLIFKKAHTASYVTQLNKKRVKEIVEIRVRLEPMAFALAHRRITPVQLDELQSLVNNIKNGAEKGDYYQVLSNDRAFHEKVWKMAGNQTLERMLTQLCTPMFAFLMVLLGTNRCPLMERVKSHQILVDALAGSDPSKVTQAVQHHTKNSWNEWYRFIPPEKPSEKDRHNLPSRDGLATIASGSGSY